MYVSSPIRGRATLLRQSSGEYTQKRPTQGCQSEDALVGTGTRTLDCGGRFARLEPGAWEDLNGPEALARVLEQHAALRQPRDPDGE